MQDHGAVPRSKKSMAADNLKPEGDFDPLTNNHQQFQPYEAMEPRERAPNQVKQTENVEKITVWSNFHLVQST